jgi:hypothetical protein
MHDGPLRSPTEGKNAILPSTEDESLQAAKGWVTRLLMLHSLRSLLLLLVTAFALFYIASEFEKKRRASEQHVKLYGLPMEKTTKRDPLPLELASFDSQSTVKTGRMLRNVESSQALERELSYSISPGCLAYKPGKESGMFPIGLANGTFQELLFKHWENKNNKVSAGEEAAARKAFPNVNLWARAVKAAGAARAPWVPHTTLYAYVPPVGSNFWLQYTSVFEPQFINMLSLVDPVLRLQTHASQINSIAYNAICSGATPPEESLSELAMGTTSETGRKLHLIALSVTRAVRKTLFVPASCADWQAKMGLTTDGVLLGKPAGGAADADADADAGADADADAFKVAACFETLVIPRAYSLGQFYSNKRRLAFDSVHRFRTGFYRTYHMAEPRSVCAKLEAAVAYQRQPTLRVGIFGREDSSHRRLRNADAIESWVRSGELGIEGVRMEVVRIRSMSGPLERIANTLGSVDMLIAPHGAHWANAIFLPERAVGIEVNAGCWPAADYNPWQEFHRGSASFAHVMDSLALRNYEIYGCSEALNASRPRHWHGRRGSASASASEKYNCNSLRGAGTCAFDAPLDALRAVFGMVEDLARGADMSPFRAASRHDRECRVGCCSHAEMDCGARFAPLCPSVELPPTGRRPTTEPRNLRLDAATLPRVQHD